MKTPSKLALAYPEKSGRNSLPQSPATKPSQAPVSHPGTVASPGSHPHIPSQSPTRTEEVQSLNWKILEGNKRNIRFGKYVQYTQYMHAWMDAYMHAWMHR